MNSRHYKKNSKKLSYTTLLFYLPVCFPTVVRGVFIEQSRTKVVLENSNGGCIGIDGGEVSEGAKLMLVDCDNPERNDTVWLFDEARGLYMSGMDNDYCWTVQGRVSAPFLQLHKCKSAQRLDQIFEFHNNGIEGDRKDERGQINYRVNQCVVHSGVNADVGEDSLVVKQCKLIDDDNRKEWNILKYTTEENKKMEFADPFDVDLPYFSGKITKGYSDPNLADFDKHLAAAAAMVINKEIQRNIDIEKNSYYPIPMLPTVTAFNREESLESVSTQDVGSNDSGEVTDYETNVQEEGVDEADIMKADENNIYASYGDYILVWDKNGKMKAQLKMPEIVSRGGGDYGMLPFMGSRGYWNPKPHIDSLLLVPGYLVVFVSGYGKSLKEKKIGKRKPILYNYLDTQIRIYSTAAIDEGELTLKAVKNTNGRFVDARLVEGRYVHAVTMSGIDTYSHLINPLNRNQYFAGLSDEEYYVAAQEQVSMKSLPQFIAHMREELTGMDSDFPKFLQINRWQKNVPVDDRILGTSYSDGIINNVASVISFDVTSTDLSGLEGELRVSSSSFMTPYSWMHMYGTDNEIILATEGWNWNAFSFGQEQSTYIVGLVLDGASAEFVSVGTIAGHLLNSFALDVHDNKLRVATTIRQTWRLRSFIVDEAFVMAEEEDATPLPEIEGNISQLNTENELIQESLTENYVIALNLQSNENGEMEEIGRVKIGEPNESIFSIRFFDDFAYVVTFERTDPFYVIGLHNSIPTKLGEFKLNGFSSYLHPMTPDNKFLIGVGQNATDDGRITGLMITIFNATVPENPVAVVSYTVENDDNRYSSSNVEWEHKSFRYLQENKKLIIPLNEHYRTVDDKTGFIKYESFRGFAVFDVTMETINESYRVSHKPETCYYCGGYLPPRSFVYEGNLMTVRDSVVQSTDLNNGEEKWSFQVEIGEVDQMNLCCPRYRE